MTKRVPWNKGLHYTAKGSEKGYFPKGHVPWNKGMKGWSAEGTERTRFKKGNVPHNTRAVGTVVKHKDGYRYIKTKHGMVVYQRWLYERAHHCKVPKDSLVIFLDGNRDNFDIDNLMVVTRGESAIINHEHLQVKGSTEYSRTGVLIAKLKKKARDKMKGKR